MKKNIIKCRIMLLIACFFVFTQSHAYAQGPTTTAQVEFVEGKGPTFPVDPDEPETPENGGEEQSGSLAIVKVSHFDFDSVEIFPGNKSYDIITLRPNIQVVDLRGTEAGWRVTASLSGFSSEGAPSLRGASILFHKGRPNSLSISDPPVQKDNLELTSDDEPLMLINAAKGAGSGLWIMRWYSKQNTPAYVTLEVPSGSATLGSHSATLNWILEDTPSAEATPPVED